MICNAEVVAAMTLVSTFPSRGGQPLFQKSKIFSRGPEKPGAYQDKSAQPGICLVRGGI
ncbi:MAG: hypothetical protein KIS92_01225 [Planctomycetota bacterium]|nr:hypothetical protein [Planctomycetota bacterium]